MDLEEIQADREPQDLLVSPELQVSVGSLRK